MSLIAPDTDAWFADLDRFKDVPLFDDDHRNQPLMPAGSDVSELTSSGDAWTRALLRPRTLPLRFRLRLARLRRS